MMLFWQTLICICLLLKANFQLPKQRERMLSPSLREAGPGGPGGPSGPSGPGGPGGPGAGTKDHDSEIVLFCI